MSAETSAVSNPSTPPPKGTGTGAVRPLLVGLLVGGAVLHLAAAAFFWGFVVDDAWIPARYASHWLGGKGYGFNANAPSDGVTPLPWVPLLAMVAKVLRLDDVRSLVTIARLLGAGAMTVGYGSFLWAQFKHRRAKGLAIAAAAAAFAPLAAWQSAGLETGFVTGLMWLALACQASGGRSFNRLAPWLVGLAGMFRPELFGFCVCLIVGLCVWGRPRNLVGLGAAVLLLASPLIRFTLFGRLAPLALWAKQSSGTVGLRYVGASLLFAGWPGMWLAVLWRNLRAARPWLGCLGMAVAVHGISLALAGGDWMPFFRLWVPALPAAVALGVHAAQWVDWKQVALAVTLAVLLAAPPWVLRGPSARLVWRGRVALIEQLRQRPPLLRPAAIDIGWLGEAHAGPIVDLAGLTDPAIATLPGGHTSKHVRGSDLLRRDTSELIFLRRSGIPRRADGGPYARVLEEWLAHDEAIREAFSPCHLIRGGGLEYVVWRRRKAQGFKCAQAWPEAPAR